VEQQNIDTQFMSRQTSIFEMIKSILPSNLPSQDFFRTCGGFQCIVRLFYCMEGIASPTSDSEAVDVITMKLLETTFSLLLAATDPNARNLKQLGGMGTPPIVADTITFDGDLSLASSELPSTTNLHYLRKYGFYIGFANAIAGTGILKDVSIARNVVYLALELVHPKLTLSAEGGGGGRRTSSNVDAKNSNDDMVSIRNADATRLVLGLSTRLPDTEDHKSLAKCAFDELLRLCANDMAGSSLTRLASSGLCTSLTSRQEFASMLEDRSHFLYSRFVLLLRRIAAFSMTYIDFVSLLRCVAGPILLADQVDVDDDEDGTTAMQNNRIRLAVISSSVQNKKAPSTMKSESWQTREISFCNRLETLSVIAERGDRVARCEVGGDSLNSIAMYMQKVPLEDRMYKLAEQGRLKFLEIERVDASAQSGVRSTDNSGVWNPLVSSGFTYSVWMRQHHSVKDGSQCSLFIFDISSPPIEKSSSDGSGLVFPYASVRHEFFSCWYDIPNQRFCVLTSSNSRGEPTCFPVSP
jgi:flagellar basal body rod protein FlgC